MKTVGIYGGSFSPVHSGHMAVACAVIRQNLADEVWFMPCRRNPLKATEPGLEDAERLSLLKKALDYHKHETEGRLRLSELELEMPAPSYTRDTLRRLVLEHPDYKFRLICGADSYLDFHKWKDWKWIEENFDPIVYPRPGYEISNIDNHWTYLRGVEETDISSSEIRRAYEEGTVRTDMMPWLKN